MPLTACRHVRKMRGGAQSHLLEADDGNFYIVKFRNNPQHRRILVNELVSDGFPEDTCRSPPRPPRLFCVTPEFLAANPEIFIHLGTQRIPVAPGWHFGSRHPGNPDALAVYDFVPDTLLGGVQQPGRFPGRPGLRQVDGAMPTAANRSSSGRASTTGRRRSLNARSWR